MVGLNAEDEIEVAVSEPVTSQEPEVDLDFTLTEPVSIEKGKRGRKPGTKQDGVSKLERSRMSARECRVRKKLRYEYLEELVQDREVRLEYVNGKEQIVDIFTKPLSKDAIFYLRGKFGIILLSEAH